jgi:hypothetical protein
MSRRSEKARAKGEARKQAKADEGAKPVRFVRRWRMTIVFTIVLAAMLLIGLLNSFRDPRVTLRNQTGFGLTEIRLDFPGGNLTVPPLPDKKSVTFALHPDKAAPAPAPGGMWTLHFRRDDGASINFRSRPGDRGSHEIFTALTQPNGSIHLVPNTAEGGPGIDFKAWLRRIGIRL